MIAATEDFLRQMKWDEHQAVLVAHTDKSYSHVHVMLNMIHPETGLKLDDNFERRRAQSWAEQYERENGGIRCENRLLNIAEREPAPTRPAWMAFKGVQHEFEERENKRAAAAERGTDASPEIRGPAKEWEILKNMQRDERLAFFAEGKMAFKEMRNSVYREVREEFRERWADYYAEQRDGADPAMLKELKATLVNDQKAVLDERRDHACGELRESRESLYRDLLAGQRDQRQNLTARQAIQLDSLDFMDVFRTEIPGARNDTGQCWEDRAAADVEGADFFYGERAGAGTRSGADAGARVGDGIAMGILQFFDFAANAFSPPSPQPRKAPSEPDAYFSQAAREARVRDVTDRDRAHAREEEEHLARQSAQSRQ
jgi:MobA/VirD2-like, nuclease domain